MPYSVRVNGEQQQWVHGAQSAAAAGRAGFTLCARPRARARARAPVAVHGCSADRWPAIRLATCCVIPIGAAGCSGGARRGEQAASGARGTHTKTPIAGSLLQRQPLHTPQGAAPGVERPLVGAMARGHVVFAALLALAVACCAQPDPLGMS